MMAYSRNCLVSDAMVIKIQCAKSLQFKMRDENYG